jgi:beta-glucanase (GH16 family)
MPTEATVPLTLLATLAAAMLFSSSTPAAAPASAPTTAPAGGQWKLVWADEFDYKGLPDPNKWGYEVGFVRNNESQYYTRARLENARVEGGMLVIEGRRETYQDPNAKGRNAGRTAQYTAASLITQNKADWKFGRIEVRAKLPRGLGVWPAIWMLGADHNTAGWPACGEIDIMEFVGKDPNHVHSTVHYQKDGKHKSSGGKLTVTGPWEDFHVYAVEWFADRMDFYFDQSKVHTFPIAQADGPGGNPFHKPQYLLINLALGGSWGGKIDDAIFPQKFLIDYVRVYQRP